jgi:ABC-type branched-subunit amino acid transport system ATPase component
MGETKQSLLAELAGDMYTFDPRAWEPKGITPEEMKRRFRNPERFNLEVTTMELGQKKAREVSQLCFGRAFITAIPQQKELGCKELEFVAALMKVRSQRLQEMRDYEMKKMYWYIYRLISEERTRPDDPAQPGSGYPRTLEREIEQIQRCHEMVARIEKELGQHTLNTLEEYLPPKETAEFKPVGVFELDNGDHVTMVRSSDGFYSFDLGEAYPEPNITRRELAELIQPMLVSVLAGSTESGQAFTLALYFNSTRWYVTIEAHVPAYQKKPKTEFHAVEARPASTAVLEWELTFAKLFLKSYGRILNDCVRALHDFSCSIQAGEIVGLIGPNGAGKTTLFNVITGFTTADRGGATFRGRNLLGRSAYRIANMGIARTFQDLRLIRRLSVLDNVLLAFRDQPGERLRNVFFRWRTSARCEAENRKDALSLLEAAGLAEKAVEPAENLSYGQQKLLSLICCMAAGADLLLLDEPVAGIAPEMIEKILSIIRSLPAQGKTVILLEHNMDAVMQVCDRVIFMDAGAVVSEGTPEQVWNDPKVIEAYLD